MKKSQSKISFNFIVKDSKLAHFSLDKVNADFAHNQIALNSIVGTLVKYGSSGKIESYLAESWTESTDKKQWSFKLRPNLFSETGSPITAEYFTKTLTSNLLDYSARSSVIMFDHLIGWNDFIHKKTKDINGLTFHNDTVNFSFDNNPGDLLELLRMPYFGLWIEENGKLISTSAYKLDDFKDEKIKLSIRGTWFTVTESSIPNVEISFESLEHSSQEVSKNSISRYPFYVDTKKSNDGYWIISPPTRLESIILSPFKDNFFNKIENRKVFRNKIKKMFPHRVGAQFFYQSAKTNDLHEDTSVTYLNPDSKISQPLEFVIRKTNYSSERLSQLEELITLALEGSGRSFVIIPLETKDADWVKRSDLNITFDSRVAFVDIGGFPDWAILKMMFCSKLGINFPDPAGKICNLVSKGISTSEEINQEGIDQFNQILYDDAVVVPIQHHSDKWFVTNDIDPKSMPPTTLYPQFELIRTK